MGKGMKLLFLVYHALSEHSGISKKILAQVRGLEANGNDVTLCTLQIDPDGTQKRVCNGVVIRSFGTGVQAKVEKRISYRDIVDYVRENGIEGVYIRYDINSDPFTIGLVKRLKSLGAAVIVEIPTWPYDGEFKGQSLKFQVQIATDKTFRKGFFKHVDRVVTCAPVSTIFGVPTIINSNGIDFSRIPLIKETLDKNGLRMLSVANIHLWHGLDRLIEGMAANPQIPSELHIVGDGLPDIIDGYRRLIEKYSLGDRIKILGPMFGEALDKEFNWANIAVGSLGRHRSGVNTIKTLKNREYAARGLSFFYSEDDPDFDDAGYVYKMKADESPADLSGLWEFFRSMDMEPAQIRESVRGLSWEAQLSGVTKCFLSIRAQNGLSLNE